MRFPPVIEPGDSDEKALRLGGLEIEGLRRGRGGVVNCCARAADIVAGFRDAGFRILGVVWAFAAGEDGEAAGLGGGKEEGGAAV